MDKCINLYCAFRYYCSQRNTDKQFTPPCQADKTESEEWVNFADDLIPIIDEAESEGT